MAGKLYNSGDHTHAHAQRYMYPTNKNTGKETESSSAGTKVVTILFTLET